MDDRVELLGKAGVKIMAPALGIRPIDHTNSPFEMLGLEFDGQLPIAANNQKKVGQTNSMKHPLITIFKGRADPFALRDAIPIRGGGDGARISCEADENTFVSVPLTHKLSDVQFSAL